MGLRLRLVLVVLFFVATLVTAVYLQGVNHRTFYTLALYRMEQNRLRQELWQKQLRVESLINPAAIADRLDEESD
jgi:Tfp pilus assembly protein PilO